VIAKSKLVEPGLLGDLPIPGFRHFLGEPDGTLAADDRFKIKGANPRLEKSSQEELQGLMGRLAHRMSVPYEVADNPKIPAGYTYLMQLMAHDLVQSSVSASIGGKAAGGIRNHRQGRLRLDTVYGAGPGLEASAYDVDSRRTLTRAKLRLGRISGGSASECPFRELARVLPENHSGATFRSGCTDALVLDARNDDHAILSQFTVLLHLLHNGIVEKLLPPPSTAIGATTAAEAARNNFLCARAAVTLIYRNIIRHDLLPRVLHDAIYDIYRNVSGVDALLETPDDSIPLEFTHAAFRFGHPMVRNTYDINERSTGQQIKLALSANSSRGPLMTPLGRDWIVNWSKFFAVNGSAPNLSQRIRPTYSPGLLDQELFPALTFTDQPGLACHDLFSSIEVGLWSVDRLIEKLANIDPRGVGQRVRDCVSNARILADKQFRTQKLADWLSQHRASTTLRDEDIPLIAQEPPLLLFVLFEAWAGETSSGQALEGANLGVLGSIIVAEVIFGALHDQAEGESADLRSALADLNERFFGDSWDAFAAVPELDRMDQLIPYIARLNGLENTVPRFV
jgi:hypothetical protein